MDLLHFSNYYFLILLSFLLTVAAYYHLIHFEVGERERELLNKANLNLEIILGLLEAPDTKYLIEKGEGRTLFIEYSRSLRNDVLSLVERRGLGLKAYFLVLIFYLTYGLLYAKTALFTHLNDIRLLSGLELRIVRSLTR